MIFAKPILTMSLFARFLGAWPKAWKAKVTTIQEARDLTKLSMEELIGLLIIYELNIYQIEDEEESKKRRTITFKLTFKSEESDKLEDEV